MTERVYVALDLETTGLDATRDSIIEIGALRFQGDQILERFTTLVNPQRAIPLRVQQITGIRQADVADAPTLAEVAPELLAFVRNDVTALVAHNAGFDIGFLRAAGLQFHRPALDTFELATIVLPSMASYSLGELCLQLDIPLVDAHRAADDAEATARLFMQLQRQLRHLPEPVLQLLATASPAVDWPLRFLFTDALNQAPSTQPRRFASAPVWRDLGKQNPPTLPRDPLPVTAVSPALIDHFFANDGPLAAQFGQEFEVRPGQVAMAHRVLQALNEGDHWLIEAGTGTGKSLAYLLPAACWSVANQQRVVIATNTLTLQDQLLHKDLPQLHALLAAAGVDHPRTALLKGRSNYLCTRRLHAWRTSHRLNAGELTFLAKVLVWLTTTTTGDMSELLLVSPTDRLTWLRICSDGAVCSSERCGEQIRLDGQGLPSGDFFLQARAQAEGAHLLVTNHALLLADLAAGGRVLPAYEHLIVDEAHHLEEVATDQLTARIEWRWLQGLVARLNAEEDLGAALAGQARQQGQLGLIAALQAISAQVGPTRRGLQEFADHLQRLVSSLDKGRRGTTYAQRMALDSRLRAQSQWSQLEVEWEEASSDLRLLVEQVGELVDQLEQAQWWLTEPTATVFGELRSLFGQIQEQLTQLDQIIFAPAGQTGLVQWLEVAEHGETVNLAAAPLYVNTVIDEGLVQRRRSAIFTSATLRTATGFDFIRERLGLWEAKTALVDSPFDYVANTLLLLPNNLPAPNHPAYQAAVEQAIIDTALAAGGRTLALFTSYAQLRTTAEAIRAPLDQAGITVLQQGMGGRNRLLREFRQTERAVLLGTRSFWEGIDLPGDELQCLLILRLPFAVPSDPLVSARTADLDDAFQAYTLPDAVLRFRQGFGRLIRRASDRGVVVILDNRVWTRDYGSAFLEALPPCTVYRGSLADVGEEIRKWLG